MKQDPKIAPAMTGSELTEPKAIANRSTHSGLRIIRSGAAKPSGAPKIAFQSAFGRMMAGFCDELDREVDRLRKS